jgi:lipopolysaccharide/colanic/teichoic acid biosynthesis glycosyltransferase
MMHGHHNRPVTTADPVNDLTRPDGLIIPGHTAIGYQWCKRAVDVSLAITMLVCLTPVLIVIAVLIRLDSPGPVIYRQMRVGSRRRKQGQTVNWEVRSFCSYKFRSMYCNADESVHQEYIHAFCNGAVHDGPSFGTTFKLKNDSRITRVGRYLRRTSLDELPQLVNVLRGDMSLVGPRPVPVYEVSHYDARDYERFAAMSGLTGLWQVKGRGRVSFERMMQMDIEYARHASLWLDLKILILTLPAVVLGHGAE